MASKENYKIIAATNVPSLTKSVNSALASWYVLAGNLIILDWTFYQPVIDSSLTWLTINEIKKNTNAWAVAVSGTINVKEV